MTEHGVDTEQVSGTRDVTYDLISVIYHALQGAETYAVYARDADKAGASEVDHFFKQLVDEERLRADRAKELLQRQWIGKAS